MHDAGVRGVRFNFVRRLVDFTPRDELMEIAGRVAKLGWHVVIYFEAVDLPELWDFFTALPTAVVVGVTRGSLQRHPHLSLVRPRGHTPDRWLRGPCQEAAGTLPGPIAG